jgi:hypothetical protein
MFQYTEDHYSVLTILYYDSIIEQMSYTNNRCFFLPLTYQIVITKTVSLGFKVSLFATRLILLCAIV